MIFHDYLDDTVRAFMARMLMPFKGCEELLRLEGAQLDVVDT